MSAAASSASAARSQLAAGTEGQYCFLVEWFDQQAAIMRQYHLLYYLLDDTIEVHTHSSSSSRQRMRQGARNAQHSAQADMQLHARSS